MLGGGDVGSAVAHVLFRSGARVLIAELPQSAHARRGMAFTDALFDGRAKLDGIIAERLQEVAEIETCWNTGAAIPIVCLPESLLTAAIAFHVVIDATMRRESVRADMQGMAQHVVGLGPGYVPGLNCDLAIETQWGPQMGRVLRDRAAADRAGGPHPLDGVTRERFVVAPVSGVWHAIAELGQRVTAGETLGTLGGDALAAPLGGYLRGLTRDGVEVRAGQRVAEVDPRQMPEVTGLGERPLAIARGVLEAIGGLALDQKTLR